MMGLYIESIITNSASVRIVGVTMLPLSPVCSTLQFWEEFAQIPTVEAPGAFDNNEVGGKFFFELFHGGVTWLFGD